MNTEYQKDAEPQENTGVQEQQGRDEARVEPSIVIEMDRFQGFSNALRVMAACIDTVEKVCENDDLIAMAGIDEAGCRLQVVDMSSSCIVLVVLDSSGLQGWLGHERLQERLQRTISRNLPPLPETHDDEQEAEPEA